MEENTYYTDKKLHVSKRNGTSNHYESLRKYNDGTRRNFDSRIANWRGEVFANESKHVEYDTNATPEFLFEFFKKIML